MKKATTLLFALLTICINAQEKIIDFTIYKDTEHINFDKDTKLKVEVAKNIKNKKSAFYKLGMFTNAYNVGIQIDKGIINFVKVINDMPGEIIAKDIEKIFQQYNHFVIGLSEEKNGWKTEIYTKDGELLTGTIDKPNYIINYSPFKNDKMIVVVQCEDYVFLLNENWKPILKYEYLNISDNYYSKNKDLIVFKTKENNVDMECLYDYESKKIIIPYSKSKLEITLEKDIIKINGREINYKTSILEVNNYELSINGDALNNLPVFVSENYYKAKKNNNFYIQKREGNIYTNIDDIAYDEILTPFDYSYSDDIRFCEIIIKKDNKYHILLNGRIATEAYDTIMPLPFNRFIVKQNNKYGLISKTKYFKYLAGKIEESKLFVSIPIIYDSYKIKSEFKRFNEYARWNDHILTMDFYTNTRTDVYVVDTYDSKKLTSKKVRFYYDNLDSYYGILYLEDGSVIVYDADDHIKEFSEENKELILEQLGNWYVKDRYGNWLVKHETPKTLPAVNTEKNSEYALLKAEFDYNFKSFLVNCQECKGSGKHMSYENVKLSDGGNTSSTRYDKSTNTTSSSRVQSYDAKYGYEYIEKGKCSHCSGEGKCLSPRLFSNPKFYDVAQFYYPNFCIYAR